MNYLSDSIKFIIFLIDGVIIGFLFDIFRIIRKSFKTPDFFTYIEDVLFGIISGIVLVFSIIIFNNGVLRLFVFIGIFLGIIIYFLSISKYIILVNVKVINITTQIIVFIFKTLFFPLFFLLRLLKKVIKKVIKKSQIITKNVQKIKGFSKKR